MADLYVEHLPRVRGSIGESILGPLQKLCNTHICLQKTVTSWSLLIVTVCGLAQNEQSILTAYLKNVEIAEAILALPLYRKIVKVYWYCLQLVCLMQEPI